MCAYLMDPIREKSTTVQNGNRLSCVSSSMQGWRLGMEDAHISALDIDVNTSLFGVFDGHGGKEVAQFVSNHFESELLKSEEYMNGDYQRALERTFLKMDELLLTPEGKAEILEIQGNPYPEGEVRIPGSTGVVALLKNNDLYVANAGDSRCVLYGQRHTTDLSNDHKPTNPQEMQRIRQAGGTVIDGRVEGGLNLTRSIGDFSYKQNAQLPPEGQIITAFPEVTFRRLVGNEEFLVLACDGIWDVLSSQTCLEFLTQRAQIVGLEKAVENVLNRCLATDTASSIGCDNMTIIVVKLNY